MKNIIFLIVFIAVIAIIIAFNLGSQKESEPVTPNEPVLIAKPKEADVKSDKAGSTEPKVDKKNQVTTNNVEKKEETTKSDLRKEVKKEVGEVKTAVEQLNKEISTTEPSKNDLVRLNAKENSELRELKHSSPSQDYTQMSTTDLSTLLIKAGNENDKVEILNALSNKKTEAKESLGNILTVMASGTDLERAYAAKTIGNITQDDKDALSKLMVALKNDKDENVRKEAVRSIGEFKLNQQQTNKPGQA